MSMPSTVDLSAPIQSRESYDVLAGSLAGSPSSSNEVMIISTPTQRRVLEKTLQRNSQSNIAPWGEIVPDAPYPMSFEQFESLPDEPGWHYELVQGRLLRLPTPGLDQADIQARVIFALKMFVGPRGLGRVLGRTGFRLPLFGEAAPTELAPDIAFIAKGRGATPDTPEYEQPANLAPDLAIEIAYPHQFRPELSAKVDWYLRAGTRLVWVIYPHWHEVDIWRHGFAPQTLEAGQQLDGQDILPGFAYPIAALFPDRHMQ